MARHVNEKTAERPALLGAYHISTDSPRAASSFDVGKVMYTAEVTRNSHHDLRCQ